MAHGQAVLRHMQQRLAAAASSKPAHGMPEHGLGAPAPEPPASVQAAPQAATAARALARAPATATAARAPPTAAPRAMPGPPLAVTRAPDKAPTPAAAGALQRRPAPVKTPAPASAAAGAHQHRPAPVKTPAPAPAATGALHHRSLPAAHKAAPVAPVLGPTGVMVSECLPCATTFGGITLPGDGFRWRRCDGKSDQDGPCARAFFRCSDPNCTAMKLVQRATEDATQLVVRYLVRDHNHDSPYPGYVDREQPSTTGPARTTHHAGVDVQQESSALDGYTTQYPDGQGLGEAEEEGEEEDHTILHPQGQGWAEEEGGRQGQYGEEDGPITLYPQGQGWGQEEGQGVEEEEEEEGDNHGQELQAAAAQGQWPFPQHPGHHMRPPPGSRSHAPSHVAQQESTEGVWFMPPHPGHSVQPAQRQMPPGGRTSWPPTQPPTQPAQPVTQPAQRARPGKQQSAAHPAHLMGQAGPGPWLLPAQAQWGMQQMHPAAGVTWAGAVQPGQQQAQQRRPVRALVGQAGQPMQWVMMPPLQPGQLVQQPNWQVPLGGADWAAAGQLPPAGVLMQPAAQGQFGMALRYDADWEVMDGGDSLAVSSGQPQQQHPRRPRREVQQHPDGASNSNGPQSLLNSNVGHVAPEGKMSLNPESETLDSGAEEEGEGEMESTDEPSTKRTKLLLHHPSRYELQVQEDDWLFDWVMSHGTKRWQDAVPEFTRRFPHRQLSKTRPHKTLSDLFRQRTLRLRKKAAARLD